MDRLHGRPGRHPTVPRPADGRSRQGNPSRPTRPPPAIQPKKSPYPPVGPTIEAYFNRGIVAAQWVSRRLGVTDQDLQRQAADGHRHPERTVPQSTCRTRSGARLFEMLGRSPPRQAQVYAALYDSTTQQLRPRSKKSVSAPTSCWQRQRQEAGRGPERRRPAAPPTKSTCTTGSSSPRALGAQQVSGRSANRAGSRAGCGRGARTGPRPACARKPTTPLIDDRQLAAEYRKQWDLLQRAGDATPGDVEAEQQRSASFTVKSAKPCPAMVHPHRRPGRPGRGPGSSSARSSDPVPDVQPRAARHAAQHDHRPTATGRYWASACTSGAINQDPSTTANPVQLFGRAELGEGRLRSRAPGGHRRADQLLPPR